MRKNNCNIYVLASLLLSGFGFSMTSIAADPLFTDVTQTAGITHSVVSDVDTFTGGGAAWIDFNNDGYDDLYVPNPLPGAASWLYQNNKDGTFSEIAAQAGVQDFVSPSMGVAIGDYNGDGFDDIFVVHGNNSVTAPFEGDQRNTLFRNNTDGTFTDVTDSANLDGQVANSMVAAFGDLDSDGDLDIYVGNYLPQGDMSSTATSTLELCQGNHFYQNNGDGTFTETGALLGIDNRGCTLGVILSDYDNDGKLDIYVTNDFTILGKPTFVDVPDVIYRNDSNNPGGALIFTADYSIGDTGNGMGIAAGDFQNDGDIDYYTTSFSRPGTNIGNPVLNESQLASTGLADFLDVTDLAGILDRPEDDITSVDPFTQLSNISWGVVFFDADNDGYIDMYKADGCINGLCLAEQNVGGFFGLPATRQPNDLYINNGNSTFREVAAIAGVRGEVDAQLAALVCPLAGSLLWASFGLQDFQCFDQSRGVISSDYDNDGDVDLFVFNGIGPSRLYSNESQNNNNDWIKVRLVSDKANHRGIGAKVRVSSIDPDGQTREQLREIHSGSSHGSTNSPVVHFGIPAGSTSTSLRVEWPHGGVTTRDQLVLNQTVAISDSLAAPSINEPLFLDYGVEGGFAVIFGSNFCQRSCNTNTPTETKVAINGVWTTPIWVQEGLLTFSVPEGATTGLVSIQAPGGSSQTSADFSVLAAPVINEPFYVVPAGPAATGSLVLVWGENFCFKECGTNNPSEVVVTVNGMRMNVNWVQDNLLSFYVTEGASSGQIKVSAPGGSVSSDSQLLFAE